MFSTLSKFLKTNNFLILVVFFAAILRFFSITGIPPSLNWDEVSHGYNAFSILKTGKDEWGEIFPVIFRAYGDYKLPVYIYLTALSESFFGVNEFAVRFPSALAGVGSVIFTYLLVVELFSRDKKLLTTDFKKLASLSALLVAIEPWSFFLSRGAFEANLALFLFVGGMYFFLKASRKPNYYLLSTMCFGLTVWTYNSYRVFTPLLLLTLIVLFKSELLKALKKNKNLTTYYLLLTAFFFLPMFYQLLNPAGQARYGNVAILDEGAIAQINQERNSGCPRIYCNKFTYFAPRFLKNYFSHFSPGFLFLEGGTNYQFSTPARGLINPINSLFLIIGLIYLIRSKSNVAGVLISWLLLAPIPSSLTREAPHVLRTITVLPIPMILASYGVLVFIRELKSRPRVFVLTIYIIVTAIYLENYLVKYLGEYRRNYSWSWQYGYKQVVDYAKTFYDRYDKIIVTKKYGEPHEFILFYWPWNPEKYRNDANLTRFYQSNWYWVDAFDKFYFVNDWQINEEGEDKYEFKLESGESVLCLVNSVKCLLVTSPGNVPEGWEKLETINFLDGQPAFEIYSNSASAEE